MGAKINTGVWAVQSTACVQYTATGTTCWRYYSAGTNPNTFLLLKLRIRTSAPTLCANTMGRL